MKKILSVLICLLLVAGFTACQKSEKEPSATSPSTSQTTSTPSTSQATTSQSTTKKADDISFIYSGYWYESRANSMCAYKFNKDSTADKTIYRRSTLTSSSKKADQSIEFTYTVSGNILTLKPKNQEEDEESTYIVDYSKKTLTLSKDDPESSSTIVLANKNELSVSQAKELWMPAN